MAEQTRQFLDYRDERIEQELRMLTQDELIERLRQDTQIWDALVDTYIGVIEDEWSELEADRIENEMGP